MGLEEWSMLEVKTDNSAAAAPRPKADAAKRAGRKTAAPPGTAPAAARQTSAKRRDDSVHERIQRRAYELWESEGRPTGREHANWLQAEREIARVRSPRLGAHQ
jgi:hypothetical protein